MEKLKIGMSAPLFKGVDENGKEIAFSTYKGKITVIYFYPKDQTPGCTVQACNLRDNYELLTKNNISIIGISADSVQSHLNFKTKQNLPFTLIADVDKSIIEQFGVWGPKKFMGKEYDGIHRTTFILDEDLKVIQVIEKPKTKNHSEEILEFLAHRK
jgi:peroxiredoxin Q/BCP